MGCRTSCRKTHLFDIDIPGKITFKESDTLTPGSELTCLSTKYGKIGVGICYDLRFPELTMAYRRKGAQLIVFPGAFNMTTGMPQASAAPEVMGSDGHATFATQHVPGKAQFLEPVPCFSGPVRSG